MFSEKRLVSRELEPQKSDHHEIPGKQANQEISRQIESNNQALSLSDEYNVTKEAIMADLFETDTDEAKLALGPNFLALCSFIDENVKNGFTYRKITVSHDDFFVRWVKEGKTVLKSLGRYLGKLKMQEILPLFSGKLLAKQEALKIRKMAEEARDPEVARKYGEKFVLENLSGYFKKVRRGISDDEILASDLVQEEILPVVISGIQTGSPYKVVFEKTGFRLKNQDSRHHREQRYTLDDFGKKLMYIGNDEMDEQAEQAEHSVPLSDIPPSSDEDGGQALLEWTELKYLEKMKRYKEIIEAGYSREQSVLDQQIVHDNMTSEDIFSQLDSIAGKQPALKRLNELIKEDIRRGNDESIENGFDSSPIDELSEQLDLVRHLKKPEIAAPFELYSDFMVELRGAISREKRSKRNP